MFLKPVTRIAIIIFVCIPFAVYGAKYAGESFTLGAGARPMGMGGAFVAIADDPSGVYYNPAGLALVESNQLLLLHSETFGSLINHDFIAFSRPSHIGSRSGSLAVGIYRVGGGGILLTEWDAERGRPVVTSEESHYDYLFLFGGGMRLKEHWRIGGSGKVILRSLAKNSAWGLGVDCGLQYGTTDGLSLGMALSNATSSFIAYDNGTKESILPSLRLGFGYSRHFQPIIARVAADGEFLFEGRKSSAQLHAGKVSLDSHIGGELSYEDVVTFRVGSDIGRLTFGVGLKFYRFRLDGAYMNHKDLDNSYRLSLNIAL